MAGSAAMRRRWADDLSDVEVDESASIDASSGEQSPIGKGRRGPRCTKAPPIVMGFEALSFSTEWGSRWVQSRFGDAKELQTFAVSCRGRVLEIATDVHAHHALRRALELLRGRASPCPFSEPLLEEIKKVAATLVKDRYGCRVAIAATTYDGVSSAATAFVDELLEQAISLAPHFFGTHVLQAAMWHRSMWDRNGLDSASAALQQLLPTCWSAWFLACVETGLELRLDGLAKAAAKTLDNCVLIRKSDVLRWIMRDAEARQTLMTRMDGLKKCHRRQPWLLIGEMIDRRPKTYLERACKVQSLCPMVKALFHSQA